MTQVADETTAAVKSRRDALDSQFETETKNTTNNPALNFRVLSTEPPPKRPALDSGPSGEEAVLSGGEAPQDDGEMDASGRRKSPRPRHLVLARQHSSTSNSSEEGIDKDSDRCVPRVFVCPRSFVDCLFKSLIGGFKNALHNIANKLGCSGLASWNNQTQVQEAFSNLLRLYSGTH